MLEIWYSAREKFDPSSGRRWSEYVHWSKLTQLRELLTLDTILCPDVIESLIPDDWMHNIHQDFHILFFRDLDYLLARVRVIAPSANILAVSLEPPSEPHTEFQDTRFEFQGYDLLDRYAANSALTNCGGFDKAFANADLSEVGLLQNYRHAREVQERLRRYYPDHPHTDCSLWAVWKMSHPNKLDMSS